MRVGCGVAMSGKMFCCRYHARALRPLNKSGGEASDTDWILAKRANVDDRIRRVVVHVNNWSQHMLNAERSRFVSRYLAHATRVIGISSRAGCHHPAEVRRIKQTHPGAPFEIRRND